MADELDHPAHQEHAQAHAEPGGGALHGQGGPHPETEPEQHRHHQAEAQVEAEVVERGNQRHQGRRRQPEAEGFEARARQQHGDGDHDQRDADEVGGDIASVAMVLGVLAKLIDEGFHGRGPQVRGQLWR
ncbi:hypothetical protein D9M68_703160 [compost metagenome]